MEEGGECCEAEREELGTIISWWDVVVRMAFRVS